jgi:hypothetical protein
VPLEHEPTRLTPEQRDRVLDLAARLQSQHEAGIGVDDLVQAAAEAGIDPRFVHMAARSVVATPPEPPARTIPSPDRHVAGILMGVLTMLNAVVSLLHLGRAESSVGAVWFILLAGVTGVWAVRGRLPVWLVPAVLLMTLLTTQTFLHFVGHRDYDRYREIVMMVMILQTVVALIAGAVTRAAQYFHSREGALRNL